MKGPDGFGSRAPLFEGNFHVRAFTRFRKPDTHPKTEIEQGALLESKNTSPAGVAFVVWGKGIWVWGSGSMVYGLQFIVYGSGFKICSEVSSWRFPERLPVTQSTSSVFLKSSNSLWRPRLRVEGLGRRVEDLGFGVESLGFRVYLGFGAEGCGFLVYCFCFLVHSLGFGVEG